MKITNHAKLFGGLTILLGLGLLSSCTRGLSVLPSVISTPTFTRTATSTATSIVNTATSTATLAFTSTSTSTNTPTSTFTITNTPIFSFTFTNTPTITSTPTNTFTPTSTFTFTATATPTSTATATNTVPPAATPTPNPNYLYEDWDSNNLNYAFGNPWAGTPPGYMYGFYSGGTATVNVTNDTSVYHDGANSLSASVTYLNDNGGVGGLAEFILRSGHAGYGVNYTSMSAQPAYLSFWVRSSQPITLKAFIYGTTSFYTNTNPANGPVTPLTISTPNQWTNFALPVTASCWDASFAAVDWTNFAAVGMDFMGPIGGSFPYQVTLNLDDIHFYP